MLKTIVTIILLISIALVLLWPWIKKHIWLKICQLIVNHWMGGKKQ